MQVPASFHVRLYNYWDAKRGERLAPGRPDIDPCEIPRLLPSIALVDRDGRAFRWRLMGSRIAQNFGCDLTGQTFGGHVGPQWFVNAMTATFERVLDEEKPVFEETAYTTPDDTVHAVSRLILPLHITATHSKMLLMMRIATAVPSKAVLLKGAAGRVCRSTAISSADELACLAAEWERAARLRPVARVSPAPILRIANIWGGGAPHIIQGGMGKAVRVS